ncbi:hypothetical protein [Natrinema longum]|uniref:Uncharacterized protein n=1 Tax=Natrinema longum TaxID=370324 RepID=A0A8A2UD61_9EURY|nr:hypothetical protein [Natrinema longum]MBZ6495442.1 hypothetical protein [Natrinema longum]QSW86587.1 hypothetical protein J0X27_07160 [Natrinema longum]
MPPRLDPETDFAELTARVRTQSQQAPGSDTERVTIRSLERVSSTALATLLETAESEHLEPGALVFVLSRANAERLCEREYDIDDVDELEDVLGRRVRVEAEMPDDAILLLHPDAVDGAEPVEPEAIACGILGTDG